MKINNVQEHFCNSDIFFCYSFNLERFLQQEKNIYFVDQGLHKKTNKIYFMYIKTDELNSALKEWSNRKTTNNFYLPKQTGGDLDGN